MEGINAVDQPSKDDGISEIPSSCPSEVDQGNDVKREKMFRKRALVVNEIVNSEATYLSRLKTTVDVFMVPFRAKKVLSTVEFEGQFGKLELIRDMHEKLYEELSAAQCNDLLKVGKIFKDFSYFLKMYKQYLACFEGAMVKRAKLLISNKKFASFLEDARQDPRCMGMSFDSFLVEPVQRVPRYRMLLEELLKYTPSDHDDYADIVAALEIVREVAAENNEAIRQQEGMDKVYQVMMQLDSRYSVNLLDMPSRVFVRQGDLMKQCRRGRKEFRFWLFNDKILYGESTGLGTFRPNREIMLSRSRVTSVVVRGEAVMRIESPAKSFDLWMKDAEEAESWVNEILALQQREESGLAVAGCGDIAVAPVWNPDTAASSCEVCGCSFSLFNRKHHCRNCGAVVCDGCSRDKMLISHVDPHKPVRVCSNCSRVSVANRDLPQASVTPPLLDYQQTKDFAAPDPPSCNDLLHPPSGRPGNMPVFVPPTKKPEGPPPPPPPPPPPAPRKPTELSSAEASLSKHAESNHTEVAVSGDDVPEQYFALSELQDIVRQRRGSLLTVYGIDTTHKELSLQDEDFVRTFGCSKEEFQILPKWKQVEKKKAVGLF